MVDSCRRRLRFPDNFPHLIHQLQADFAVTIVLNIGRQAVKLESYRCFDDFEFHWFDPRVFVTNSIRLRLLPLRTFRLGLFIILFDSQLDDAFDQVVGHRPIQRELKVAFRASITSNGLFNCCIA